jgi:hypothetical protein
MRSATKRRPGSVLMKHQPARPAAQPDQQPKQPLAIVSGQLRRRRTTIVSWPSSGSAPGVAAIVAHQKACPMEM